MFVISYYGDENDVNVKAERVLEKDKLLYFNNKEDRSDIDQPEAILSISEVTKVMKIEGDN